MSVVIFQDYPVDVYYVFETNRLVHRYEPVFVVVFSKCVTDVDCLQCYVSFLQLLLLRMDRGHLLPSLSVAPSST